jgi:hypothetical protein
MSNAIFIIVNNANPLIKICSLYFFWIALHYTSSHLYVYFCTPYSIRGFLMSPIQSPMPHCSALRYMIYNGGEYINKMWWVFGLWLCYTFTPTPARK